MSTELSRGQRIAVASVGAVCRLRVAVSVSGMHDREVQCAAVISYGGMVELLSSDQPSGASGSVRLTKGRRSADIETGNLAKLDVAMGALPDTVTEIFCLLSVPSDDRRRGRHLGNLDECRVSLLRNGEHAASFSFDGQVFTESETAVYLFKLYRRGSEWKASAVAQGFCGGLIELFSHLRIPDAQTHVSKLEAAAAGVTESEGNSITDVMGDAKDALMNLVGEQGVDFFGAGATRVRNYLLDVVPQAKREIKVLTAVVEIGLLEDIRNPRQTPDVLKPRLASRVENECWIPKEAAAWAVQVWVDAFGTGQGTLISRDEASVSGRTQRVPTASQGAAAPPPGPAVPQKALQRGERHALPEALCSRPLFMSVGSNWAGSPPMRVVCALLGANGRAIGAAALVHDGSGSDGRLVRTVDAGPSGVTETFELNLASSDGAATQVEGIAIFVGPAQPRGASHLAPGFMDSEFLIGFDPVLADSQGAEATVSVRYPGGSIARSACVVRVLDVYRHKGEWKVKALPQAHGQGWVELLAGLGFQSAQLTNQF